MEDENQWYDDYLANAHTNPHFGKITSIVLGYTKDDELRCQTLLGEEVDILNELFTTIGSYFPDHQIVMWNSSFVMPFLTTRSIACGINLLTLPKSMKHMGERPWTVKFIDLQGYSEGIGWFKSSLEDWANTLGIMYADNIRSDVRTMAALHHNVILGTKKLYDIKNTDRVIELDQAPKEMTLVEKLYSSKTITEENKQSLRDVLKKKRLTKRNKAELKEMLLALVDVSDYFTKDEDLTTKEEVITEFIKTI